MLSKHYWSRIINKGSNRPSIGIPSLSRCSWSRATRRNRRRKLKCSSEIWHINACEDTHTHTLTHTHTHTYSHTHTHSHIKTGKEERECQGLTWIQCDDMIGILKRTLFIAGNLWINEQVRACSKSKHLCHVNLGFKLIRLKGWLFLVTFDHFLNLLLMW